MKWPSLLMTPEPSLQPGSFPEDHGNHRSLPTDPPVILPVPLFVPRLWPCPWRLRRCPGQ
ncbi:Hypothetical protein FKW44_005273 [Caligus rogercresseyi]|uniref:Uncharacterized protein n=1 Tax=Caligus rogercresseyi TaxID=217165 RepID=A0A7T8KBQ1_CALRO|nr:Hypothetical protein FKW44_005273 [Caligus rogercresseyi]